MHKHSHVLGRQRHERVQRRMGFGKCPNRLGNRLVDLTSEDLDHSAARLNIHMRCTKHVCTIAALQGRMRNGHRQLCRMTLQGSSATRRLQPRDCRRPAAWTPAWTRRRPEAQLQLRAPPQSLPHQQPPSLRPWRRQLHSWQDPRRRSSTESTDWRTWWKAMG